MFPTCSNRPFAGRNALSATDLTISPRRPRCSHRASAPKLSPSRGAAPPPTATPDAIDKSVQWPVLPYGGSEHERRGDPGGAVVCSRRLGGETYKRPAAPACSFCLGRAARHDGACPRSVRRGTEAAERQRAHRRVPGRRHRRGVPDRPAARPDVGPDPRRREHRRRAPPGAGLHDRDRRRPGGRLVRRLRRRPIPVEPEPAGLDPREQVPPRGRHPAPGRRLRRPACADEHLRLRLARTG